MSTTTTLVKTARTVVASAANTAGSTTRGTVDLRTAHGGLLTIKMTNGATGPTLECKANVLVAHNAGSTPAAGSAGTDWKTLASFGNGVANNGVNETYMEIGPGAMHLEVEFTGNTGQSVTCEAFFSEITSALAA